MCGIVGFVGRGPAAAPILDALRRLEYRGYDSAGIATLERGVLARRRAVGKLRNLESRLTCEPLVGRIGIGHTRWATHGRPSEENAHPHEVDGVTVVHNGIIENYLELKQRLASVGRVFKSETDSKIMPHFVGVELSRGHDLVLAVRKALKEVRGAYAFVIQYEKEP